MQSVVVTLEGPISQFVDRRSRDRHTSLQQAVMELVFLGFDSLVQERYDNYRRGEISFGRLAQDLGITTWELSHLLEERGWPVYNLPVAASPVSQAVLQEAPIDYIVEESRGVTDESAPVE